MKNNEALYQMHVTTTKHFFPKDADVCRHCKKRREELSDSPCKKRKVMNPLLYNFIKMEGFTFDSKARKWIKESNGLPMTLGKLFNLFKAKMQNRGGK